MHLPADSVRPFPSSNQTPVAVATRLQCLFPDTDTIVADEKLEILRRLIQLQFEVPCMRMAKGVDQCLAFDSVDLIPHNRMKISPPPFN